MAKLAKAPFSPNGDLLTYVHMSYTPADTVEWRDNVPFTATMTLTGTTRGRSAARFVFKDEAGHRYEMFMASMLELLTTRGCAVGGIVSGTWIIVKRGSNYGLHPEG